MRIIFLTLILAGCASASEPVPLQRYYVDYRAYLVEQADYAIHSGPNASAPGPVKLAYAECNADWVLSGFTGNERAKLDAYARREIILTRGELSDLDARVRSRLGDSSSFDALSGTCPDKVPLFKQYFKP